MKAAVYTRYGPPEVVRVIEVEKPAPGDGEVLVKVHATTVNRTDSGWRSAGPFISRFFTGLRKPRAKVLGNEFAGEVEAIGAGVDAFAVSDRVFGFKPYGAHTEYLTIAQDATIATIPNGLSYEQAAPSTEGAHYALTALGGAKPRSGQDVLVHGATGAIGSAAVQLLKSLGARVTAVTFTEYVELVKGLGADRVIDSTAEDFTRDEQTYDLVFDAVGKSTFGACRRGLKPRGIYTSTDPGPYWQNAALVLVTPLFRGRKVTFAVPKIDQATVSYLKGLIESGQFRPLIDRTYPLDRIVEAYRYVETGRKVGNVVISVVPADR
jgi:NADPH:quinone reductase-like Zn-dependent oxidoreductase